MNFKLSFSDEVSIASIESVLAPLKGWILRLTIGGRDQDVRLEDPVTVAAPGSLDLGMKVTFLDADDQPVGEPKVIPYSTIWQVHVY